jgi:hypothetical protein
MSVFPFVLQATHLLAVMRSAGENISLLSEIEDLMRLDYKKKLY